MNLKTAILLIAFLFISFVVISGGYVLQVLPCQTQKFLENSIIGKHIIGIILCFLFIMLEGGFSFNMIQQNQHDVDFLTANAIDSLFFSIVLYIIFLLTAKMKLITNTILFSILFITYLVSTQRLYWKNRDMINNNQNLFMINFTKFSIILAFFVFFYGLIDYFIYQIKDKGKDFNLFLFFFGVNKCKKI